MALSLGVVALPLTECAPSGGGSSRSDASAAPVTPETPAPRILTEDAITGLQELERRTSRRVGVSLLDLSAGGSTGYRESERFAMASTYKVFAVGCVLAQTSDLDDVVRYAASDLTAYSPVTRKHLGRGMSVADLCAAAIEQSDNTAANLLLRRVGGPRQVTSFAREKLGDRDTQVDRYEPEVNDTRPGDPRDTSTPRAMAGGYARLVGQDVLPADRVALLRTWLERCQTGLRQIRAVVPPGWSVGDKTGHGAYGAANDIAVVSRPGSPPSLCLSVLTDAPSENARNDNDVVRQAAELVLPHVL